MSSLSGDATPFYRYSRTQAIDDGVLVPTTLLVADEDLARQAGFKWPIAVTSSVARLLEPSEKEIQGDGQSTKGRLWDVLMLLRHRMAASSSGQPLSFHVGMYMDRDGRKARSVDIDLWVAIDTTDGYPALTIMLPEDD